MSIRNRLRDAHTAATTYLDNLAARLQGTADRLDDKATALEAQLAGRRLHAAELAAACEHHDVGAPTEWQADLMWNTLTVAEQDDYIARAAGAHCKALAANYAKEVHK